MKLTCQRRDYVLVCVFLLAVKSKREDVGVEKRCGGLRILESNLRRRGCRRRLRSPIRRQCFVCFHHYPRPCRLDRKCRKWFLFVGRSTVVISEGKGEELHVVLVEKVIPEKLPKSTYFAPSSSTECFFFLFVSLKRPVVVVLEKRGRPWGVKRRVV